MIAIAGVYEPSLRRSATMTFFLSLREESAAHAALYGRAADSYLQTSFRRFIPARPIKHKDHARIVEPDVTDVALLVPR